MDFGQKLCGGFYMENQVKFYEYYAEWIELYKVGAVRDVTLAKYKMSLKWVRELSPIYFYKI